MKSLMNMEDREIKKGKITGNRKKIEEYGGRYQIMRICITQLKR